MGAQLETPIQNWMQVKTNEPAAQKDAARTLTYLNLEKELGK